MHLANQGSHACSSSSSSSGPLDKDRRSPLKTQVFVNNTNQSEEEHTLDKRIQACTRGTSGDAINEIRVQFGLGNRDDTCLLIALERYPIRLRTTFGTSHSSTTVRTNALVTLVLRHLSDESPRDIVGVGEIGLPPKKKGCYLANWDDIALYFSAFCTHFETMLFDSQHCFSLDCEINVADLLGTNYSPFDAFPSPFFDTVRPRSDTKVNFCTALSMLLLKTLDTCHVIDSQTGIDVEYTHAAKCGIEMATLDLLGNTTGRPLYDIIGIEPPSTQVSFYTAALSTLEEMKDSVVFGLKHTSFIKIKLDDNVQQCRTILSGIIPLFANQFSDGGSFMLSIDANSAWTPEIALTLLEMLKNDLPSEVLQHLYMLEQPFPVNFSGLVQDNIEYANQWRHVKEEWERSGVLVYADESVHTADDIVLLRDFISGVNIKLEKAGGIRGALHAIRMAKSLGLKVWLGMMVASRLSAAASAHLMSLADLGGDLDGSLLVTEDSQRFEGGFLWGTQQQQHGQVILPPNMCGIGVHRKHTSS